MAHKIQRGRICDLTAQEQGNVRSALRFLKTRYGGWEALSRAIRFKSSSLKMFAYGRVPSASVALRLARIAGVPVDDVLAGRFPPACPHCGRQMES